MGNSDSAAVQVERFNLASSVEAPHFIGSWMIAPTSLCDDLLAFFEAHPENHAQGKIAGGLNPASKITGPLKASSTLPDTWLKDPYPEPTNTMPEPAAMA